jgi:hypothetical protein
MISFVKKHFIWLALAAIAGWFLFLKDSTDIIGYNWEPYVQNLYKTYLSRTPADSEVNNWCIAIRSGSKGKTVSAVKDQLYLDFTSSPEYISLHS